MSYDPAQLASDLSYQVRFKIGDTNPSNELITDDEIAFALASASNNVLQAAIMCVRAMIARDAPNVDHSAHSYSVSAGANNFTQVLEHLLKEQSDPSVNVPTPVFVGSALNHPVWDNRRRPNGKIPDGGDQLQNPEDC